jgi:hypothetical protein
MSEDEKSLQFLESQFAAVSGSAFTDARLQTLASGQSVLQTKNGVIYEVFPDGTRIERKRIEAPKVFPSGTRIRLS